MSQGRRRRWNLLACESRFSIGEDIERIQVFYRGRTYVEGAQKLTVPFKRATKLAANGPQVY
ncbi:MAG: hypothetical protein AUH66_00765 [Acidobacteria bacterium 13_1_40CM_4_57_6]|nr:MAG: hypothetical protein AUH66_00765 [Acidobacteria bacterium 13_1_40CM_4_57_6]